MGGDRDDVPSAANDPIFYLHHSFIDMIFEKWLQTYKQNATVLSPYDARLLRRVLALRLQDVTFTGNWLPVEYWEYIHNNNDIDKKSEKDDDDDDDDESGRQEKLAILISRLLLRMRRMSYVASIRLDLH